MSPGLLEANLLPSSSSIIFLHLGAGFVEGAGGGRKAGWEEEGNIDNAGLKILCLLILEN